MKKLFIMANWKTNKDFHQTLEFLYDISKLIKKGTKIENEVVIAPPLTSISAFKAFKIPEIAIGAQDVSEFSNGAHTGDVSAEMLANLDTEYVIVGHSERRRFHNETCEIVNKKAQNVLNANMIPIICVGENIDEYNNKQTKQVIEKQINESVKYLDYSQIMISYEPIWAIGNKAAKPEEANEICEFIKQLTNNKCKVLYGGSVNKDNIHELGSQSAIDGFLVGGASLKPESFYELISAKID
ncbi:triose-phosphate isomerase [Mycoplasmopsis iners]|uniref:triose-phosphate isomerase n=1 Tax=Mycoplasmopsis iners TaxID=76630 RepID=UPI0004969C8B|nr:triose-phosphate isomerase [Mycoplasmopsis iners]